MGGGAWLFLVGGVICLVNSVNERDFSLLNSTKYDPYLITSWRVCVSNARKFEFIYNRSVMPLGVLGCTRATLMHSTSL